MKYDLVTVRHTRLDGEGFRVEYAAPFSCTRMMQKEMRSIFIGTKAWAAAESQNFGGKAKGRRQNKNRRRIGLKITDWRGYSRKERDCD